MSLFRVYLRIRELYSLPSIEAFGLLLSWWLPFSSRCLNFNILDDRLNAFTVLCMSGQVYLVLATLSHLLMNLNDRVYLANSFCALFTALYTGFYTFIHVLRRKTIRRLYHELVQYNQEFMQEIANHDRGETVNNLSRKIPTMMFSFLLMVWFDWFLYTTSPLIFEWVRGKPLGSTKRISTPVWPYICDINTTPCFELTYVVVATVWFFGVTSFVGSASLTISFYMCIGFMYRALGESIRNIRTDAESVARNSKEVEGELRPTHNFLVYSHMHRLLNVYIRQHQFLMRWSTEFIAVGVETVVLMLIGAPTAVGLAGLKLMTDTNYVFDEVPFIMGTMIVVMFILCLLSQMLYDASGWMHWAIYTSDWVQADHALRSKINMMMMRSFRPLVTKHGLLGTVLLHTFVVVLKSSYSFLQAMRSIT